MQNTNDEPYSYTYAMSDYEGQEFSTFSHQSHQPFTPSSLHVTWGKSAPITVSLNFPDTQSRNLGLSPKVLTHQ